MLRRNPLLMALWFEIRNRRRLLGKDPVLVWAIAVLTVSAMLGLTWTAFSGHAAVLLESYASHPRWVFCAALLHAAIWTSWKRRHFREQGMNDWLIALPIEAAAVSRALALRASAAPVMQVIAILVLVGLLDTLQASANTRIGISSLCLSAGCVLGAALGWRLARVSTAADTIIGSRYAPTPAVSRQRGASLSALSRWPIAQAFAWSHPRAAIKIVLPVLLAMPAGVSALTALGALICWLSGCYLLWVLRAVALIAQLAGDWLRATPMPFERFAWTLAKRVLAHQCLGTILMVLLLMALGSPWQTALQIGEAWLMLVVAWISVAAAYGYAGRSMRAQLLISFALIAAAEMIRQGLAIPVGLAIAAWHGRRGLQWSVFR